MSRTVLASLVLVSLVAGAARAGPTDEAIMPLDQYTSAKGKALASTYHAPLRQLSEQIYQCLPWLDVRKNGLGFRKPLWAAADDRYLSVWVWVEQLEDHRFAALTPEQRASAMFSRYGVPLLRRLAGVGDVAADRNLDGFGVILSWVKPGTVNKKDVQPINETLAFFTDRASGLDFLGRRLAASEFTNRAHFTFFDGQQEVGRLPLTVGEDAFMDTFRLKDYEVAKNAGC